MNRKMESGGRCLSHCHANTETKMVFQCLSVSLRPFHSVDVQNESARIRFQRTSRGRQQRGKTTTTTNNQTAKRMSRTQPFKWGFCFTRHSMAWNPFGFSLTLQFKNADDFFLDSFCHIPLLFLRRLSTHFQTSILHTPECFSFSIYDYCFIFLLFVGSYFLLSNFFFYRYTGKMKCTTRIVVPKHRKRNDWVSYGIKYWIAVLKSNQIKSMVWWHGSKLNYDLNERCKTSEIPIWLSLQPKMSHICRIWLSIR